MGPIDKRRNIFNRDLFHLRFIVFVDNALSYLESYYRSTNGGNKRNVRKRFDNYVRKLFFFAIVSIRTLYLHSNSEQWAI